MDARIVEFAEVLRQNGIRVSPSEVQDAARAAEVVGLEDRETFRSALRATLIKRAIDEEPFARVFDYFFSGAARTFEALDASLAKSLEEQGLLEPAQLKKLVESLRGLVGQLSPLTQAALEGNRAELGRIFRAAMLQLDLGRLETPLQAGFFSRRLLSAAGGDKLESDLKSLQNELAARGLAPDGVEIVSRQLANVLRAVEDAARKEIDRQIKARLRKKEGGTLLDRDFHTLSREDQEKAELAVRRLAERLKTRLVRKQRSYRRGQLNVRRTLRENLAWGGVPMKPYFKRRRPQRPEVVVLCDVSDSVRNVSRVMLLFTWTLQSLFFRVRSFIFVSDLAEVTADFKELEPARAIDAALAGKHISLASNSNYGRALSLFVRDQLGSITRRTTVMVIGDGRNNFNPANAWALADIKQRCKRLLWICPEDRRNWGFGDSEMHAYAKHCHQVVVVKSLGDLMGVADELLPV